MDNIEGMTVFTRLRDWHLIAFIHQLDYKQVFIDNISILKPVQFYGSRLSTLNTDASHGMSLLFSSFLIKKALALRVHLSAIYFLSYPKGG